MTRIPYADPSKLSGRVRSAVENNPANVTRMMAVASEPVFIGLQKFASSFINGSPLPAKLREIAILRAGYIADARYETWQHEALARFVGLSEEQIAAVKTGDSSAPALDEAEAAVLEFADDVIANVRASDATLAAVRKHLDDTQLTDLIFVTGCYMMISRFLETTGVELDETPIDWNTIVE